LWPVGGDSGGGQRFVCRVLGDLHIAALILEGGGHAQALSFGATSDGARQGLKRRSSEFML